MVHTSRVEAALGCWTVTHFAPPPGDALHGVLLAIWLFDGTLALQRERVFPDGTLEIVVQLDAAYRPVHAAPGDPFPPLSIAGLRTTAMTIEGPARPVRVLGMRFAPAGASALLRTSLRALTGVDLDLHDVLGRAASELGERCAAARGDAACVLAAAGWARALLARAHEPAAFVRRAIAEIDAGDGTGAVAALGARGSRSAGRFAAAFCDHVGVTPKRYARIVRFRRALALIRETSAPLAAVAGAAGYYDQPHMNAEFRVLAGMTPHAFRLAEHYPGSSSIAEQNFQDERSASR
jgi:AraC-like DNA-binding protein